MKRNIALAKRLREVLLDGHWIANTNFKTQIKDVGFKNATVKIASLNSIAALTFHINYYLHGELQVLNGGDLTISDKYSFDMPKLQIEEDWHALIKSFLTNAENFCIKIEMIDDAMLAMPFVKEQYGSYERNIEGVIEHSYYHLGQIVVLNKLINGI